MSNPAVIQLASTFIHNTEVRIEDNYAESIHLHIGLLRIDLSIKEFLDITEKMVSAANNLIHVENFDLKHFDPAFLNYYAPTLVDLKSVTIDTIKIGDIIALKYNKLPFYRPLKRCRDYQALLGNTKMLNQYRSQVNKIGQTNIERLHDIMDSVKNNGYPYRDEYIILRNNQNVILDGQHRASCLLYLYGEDHEVPVMRFHYSDNKYSITDWHPWKRVLVVKILGKLKCLYKKRYIRDNIDV